ncbi:MAG: PKD domain-containing protein [Thermoplasmata archaeon]|nr:PKD domain-containing protein [Thermoplasmata archaeon]
MLATSRANRQTASRADVRITARFDRLLARMRGGSSALVVLVVLLVVSGAFILPAPSGRASASFHSTVARPVSSFHPVTLRSADPSTAWAGNWTNQTAAAGTPPPILAPAGMVYDAHDGYVLLFGGTASGPMGQPVGETWRLVAGHWQNLTASLLISPPPRREGAAMVYDPSSAGVLLFGGLGASGYLGDTWMFSSGTWTMLSQTGFHPPSPRDAAGASYDPTTSSVILFGGVDASGPRSDLYSFAGGGWSAVTVSGESPPAACCPSVAYDVADGYLLAVLSPSGLAPSQSWSFDGQSWVNRTTALAPSARLGESIAYDVGLGVVYLFGGESPASVGALNDSWTYSAGSWASSVSPLPSAPSPRWSAGLSENTSGSNGCLVLFGGLDSRGVRSAQAGQTWTLCGRTASASSGSSGNPSNLAVALSISRSIGEVPFEVTITTNASGGSGPYNLSVCPGTGRCEQALAWDGATYSSTMLFSIAGTYTVSSVVVDSQGGSRAATATVVALAVVPLQATYTFSPLQGTSPLVVTFQAGVSGGRAPYTIEWNFGDGSHGSSEAGVSITHTYSSSGTFVPILRVEDAAGQPVNRTLPTVQVVGGPVPPVLLGLSSTALVYALGAIAVAAGATAFAVERFRIRRLAAESDELVRGMWDGRGGAPEWER